MSFGGEAVLTDVYAINRITSSVTSSLSPVEKLYDSIPDYSSMKVFGSTCFVLRPQVECNKLSSRSTVCVFLSYGDGHKGYRCYDSYTRKIYVSRHVVILEHIPFYSISSNSHIDPFGLNDNATPHIDTPLVPRDTQQPPMIVDPPPLHSPPRYPSHHRKPTQLSDFVYYLLFLFFFFSNLYSQFI